MLEFIYLFLFRVLSGAQNGFFYAKNNVGVNLTTVAMLIATVVPGYFWVSSALETSNWLDWAASGWLLVSLISTVMLWLAFKNRTKDIHLLESIITLAVLLAWVAVGGNLIYILASVYPALIIHKGLINKGSGKHWFYKGTDDKTGKTFTINIPTWLQWLIKREKISIPRMGTWGRITLAVISGMVVIINSTSLNWSVTLNDLLPFIK